MDNFTDNVTGNVMGSVADSFAGNCYAQRYRQRAGNVTSAIAATDNYNYCALFELSYIETFLLERPTDRRRN